MNAQNIDSKPKVRKESKNKINSSLNRYGFSYDDIKNAKELLRDEE